ncbi:major tail protein [Arthrobacter phage Berka]|nr:major tail protein [Arthrobacter phage Berka]
MPHTLLEIKNASFKAAVGAGALVEYADAIENAQVNITSTPYKFTPINGVVQQGAGPLTEEIVLSIGQDLTAASFYTFLRTNHGAKGKVEFFPKGGTVPKVAANVTFQAPGAIGGAGGTIGMASATLLVDGLSTITAG